MRLAEYIWIDGTKPTPQLRSKTRVLQDVESPRFGALMVQAPNRRLETLLIVCCAPCLSVPILFEGVAMFL